MTPKMATDKVNAPDIEFEETCIHCDYPFDESYVRWHAVRAIKRADKTAILGCKECGCGTPMRFQIEETPCPTK